MTAQLPDCAVLPFPTACRFAERPVLVPTPAERVLLDFLRWTAMRSRLAPRADAERACFLLAGDPAASFERCGVLFFRALDTEASREIHFHRPGAASVSPGEHWLLRLLAAWDADERAQAAALVSWRIRPPARRWMRFLSATLAERLRDLPSAA